MVTTWLAYDIGKAPGNFLDPFIKLCLFQRNLIQDYRLNHMGADPEHSQTNL